MVTIGGQTQGVSSSRTRAWVKVGEIQLFEVVWGYLRIEFIFTIPVVFGTLQKSGLLCKNRSDLLHLPKSLER
jgi:hypothetical protein